MEARIVVIAGDGVGPEVTAEARYVLEAIAARFGHRFLFEEADAGGGAYDRCGTPLPQITLQRCRGADAILFGAVGGQRWDMLPGHLRPEQAILGLRKAFDLFANLRHARTYPDLLAASPLRPELVDGVDILLVRELTAGVYFGEPRGRHGTGPEALAVDTTTYTRAQIARVVRTAFELARGRRRRLASVDKANILETSRLWREVVGEVAADYPDVVVEHLLVDNCAMQLLKRPRQFDVIVTDNLFGDILSEEIAGLVGSLGLLPSASLGWGPPSLYEPVHGSAPDIAGQGIANPVAAILSASMLLRYGLHLPQEADAVEAAVRAALSRGFHTADLTLAEGTIVGTREMGEAIVEALGRTTP